MILRKTATRFLVLCCRRRWSEPRSRLRSPTQLNSPMGCKRSAYGRDHYRTCRRNPSYPIEPPDKAERDDIGHVCGARGYLKEGCEGRTDACCTVAWCGGVVLRR